MEEEAALEEGVGDFLRLGLTPAKAHEAHPFYTEARLYHDGTLPFKDCRNALATAFEVSLLKPIQDSHFGNFKF